LLLAQLLVTGSHCDRIHGVFPFPAKTHMIIQRVLMLELASRGHHVAEFIHFMESKIIPNYTQIEVKVAGKP
jgi:phosphoribosyl 1,2-cyclic phosphodiesterase